MQPNGFTNSNGERSKVNGGSSLGQTTEEVVARVSELIKSAQLKPGDRLPPERELSKQIGVSRPSLRAGLRALSSMGVLRSRQGAGTFVADGPPTLDSEPLRLLAALHGFSFDHMFETRSILEVGAAGLAAERATSEQLATLADEIAEMYASLNNPQEYLVHDIRFHRAIAQASGNPTLATLVEMVSAVMYERRRDTIERAHDFKESLELHQQVYRAIRDRQPDEARAAMREHIVRAQNAFALEESEGATKNPTSEKGLEQGVRA
ncbi:MAG TPA: FadR/GntR family transcriptional regulator [Pyrinomonadaceae bacterium]|nr:FadR/GntR family transcriptional regulator [Pyrinomonadaceae bacterium]